MSNDDVLTVAAMGDNGWVEITYNDTTGYINGDYLTVEPMLASGDLPEYMVTDRDACMCPGNLRVLEIQAVTHIAYAVQKEEAKKQAEREEAEKRASEAGFEMTLVESYEGTISGNSSRAPCRSPAYGRTCRWQPERTASAPLSRLQMYWGMSRCSPG